jgi:hypothetical protein
MASTWSPRLFEGKGFSTQTSSNLSLPLPHATRRGGWVARAQLFRQRRRTAAAPAQVRRASQALRRRTRTRPPEPPPQATRKSVPSSPHQLGRPTRDTHAPAGALVESTLSRWVVSRRARINKTTRTGQHRTTGVYAATREEGWLSSITNEVWVWAQYLAQVRALPKGVNAADTLEPSFNLRQHMRCCLPAFTLPRA